MRERPTKLSKREQEVFHLLGLEMGNKEIAEKLHISWKTVESHKENIKNKLSLDTCRQVFKAAFIYGMKKGRK